MEKQTTTKKTQKKQNLTLLQAIETVAENSLDSKMSADFIKASSKGIKTKGAILKLFLPW